MSMILEKIKGCKAHLYVIVGVFFVLATFVILHAWPIGRGNFNLHALWSADENLKDLELVRLDDILKNASTDDNVVIVTTLNEAWAKPNSIFDIFLESFQIGEQTQPLLKHLVVLAIDEKAMNRCKVVHPHCHLLNINGVESSGLEKRFMTKDYFMWMWERTHFLGKVLELGYNFVLTDVDILWFRTPFIHFSYNDDFTIACDRFNGNTSDVANRVNGGFIYVKSNNRTINFYKYWYEVRHRYPGKNEQAVFDIIKRTKYVKDLGLKMRFLDTDIFGGFCEHGDDLNKLCTLHATCCVGLDRKIHDLRIVLNVWRNFSSLPDDQKVRGVPWRAPIKCRM